MMLTYVKTSQNNRPYLPAKPRPRQRLLCLLRFKTKMVSLFVQNRVKTHALMGSKELNQIFSLFIEWKWLWCKRRHVLDYYFNVCLLVSSPRNGTRPNLVLISTRRCQKEINIYFYLLFVFTSWWRGLLTAHYVRR